MNLKCDLTKEGGLRHYGIETNAVLVGKHGDDKAKESTSHSHLGLPSDVQTHQKPTNPILPTLTKIYGTRWNLHEKKLI